MNHTPGPWHLEQGYGGYAGMTVVADRVPVAHVPMRVQREALSTAAHNAHLIAAAPEMLETLGLLLALMRDGPAADYLDYKKVMAQAATVINKATGNVKVLPHL